MVKQAPKMTTLVVSAIRKLREMKGSTPREILNCIMSEYSTPTSHTTIKRKLVTALKRGLEYGILKQNRGHYRLDMGSESLGPMDQVADCGPPMKKQRRRRARMAHGSGCKKPSKRRRGRGKRRKAAKHSKSGRRRHKSRRSGRRKSKKIRSGRKKARKSRSGKSKARKSRSGKSKARKSRSGKRRGHRRRSRHGRSGMKKCPSYGSVGEMEMMENDPLEIRQRKILDEPFAHERKHSSRSRGRRSINQSPERRSRNQSQNRKSRSQSLRRQNRTAQSRSRSGSLGSSDQEEYEEYLENRNDELED